MVTSRPRKPDSPRRIIVLGSTGSVGVSTLAVIEHLTRTGQQPFEVVGLAAGSNTRLLAEQARRLNCPAVAVATPTLDREQQKQLAPCRRVWQGADAACELVEAVEADVVVAAIVGVAGLPATLAALQRRCIVALANKETLVAAGPLARAAMLTSGATLLPVDSEHSAIWQTLGCPADCGDAPGRVRRIVLTASGGPFRDTPLDIMAAATPEAALRHPTWDMGPKISIDSATMMNKALEVIEAHHLFQLPPEKIEVIIHPQSVVHGLAELVDHSILAQWGPPDMRTPIQAALTWPRRTPGCSDQLDWSKLSRLDFAPPDGERFPALKLAYRVIRAGGTAGAVFNAANEVAVAAFLERRIRFGRIVEVVRETLDALPAQPVITLTDVLGADRIARDHALGLLEAAAAP